MLGHFILAVRRALKKEHPTRWPERTGIAGMPRPSGKIIWIHAASVGEAQTALILLPFLERLRSFHPFTLLITTGTVTSEKLVTPRLPDWAIHQFYPLDMPRWTRRFLDYWRPNAAIWMESELWPVMLDQLNRRSIPLTLVNGRLSARSARRWGMAPALARKVMRPFALILAQDTATAAAFRGFTTAPVIAMGNLKYSASPLNVDTNAIQALNTATAARPVIVYASTHAGEETMAARLHQALKPHIPNLLSIIIPRHPSRADTIVNALPTALEITRRTDAMHLPHPATDIYLADTIGEVGLFYQRADIVYIGRSLSDDGGGGHNPLEAAHFHCAITAGPHTQNLADIYAAMIAAQAVIQAQNEPELMYIFQTLLTDPAQLHAAQVRAHEFMQDKMTGLEQTEQALIPILTQALS
ncbi:MAG: 3-deoxy-D-manno-octulosonic acid transferase [Pseudomonadota bacterium]